MWYPDLYFVNSKYAYLQEVTTPNLMVIVYPDGLIFKTMRLDVTLSCMMDLKLFPLDYQECPLTIQSCKFFVVFRVFWCVGLQLAPKSELGVENYTIMYKLYDCDLLSCFL